MRSSLAAGPLFQTTVSLCHARAGPPPRPPRPPPRPAAAALYIPTSAARLLTFKFMLELARLPALGDLLRAFMRVALNGDRSAWDRAVQLPHYNARAMPAVSLHQVRRRPKAVPPCRRGGGPGAPRPSATAPPPRPLPRLAREARKPHVSPPGLWPSASPPPPGAPASPRPHIQGLHFVQLWRSGRFRLYDYGSPAANAARYGHAAPPDVASEYWRLDIPIDICAGSHDGVIPPANVRRHIAAMRGAGVDVSYREFGYGWVGPPRRGPRAPVRVGGACRRTAWVAGTSAVRACARVCGAPATRRRSTPPSTPPTPPPRRLYAGAPGAAPSPSPPPPPFPARRPSAQAPGLHLPHAR
jgi:hypothetical protein